MRRNRLYLSGVLFLAAACGGNVGNDAANTAGTGNAAGGGGANGGSEPAGGAGGTGAMSATGGSSANYPGGMLDLTPDQFQEILSTTCTGWTDSPSVCTIAIPQPRSGQTIDPTQLRVVYEVNGRTTDLALIGLSDAACSQGGGWYLDTNGNITFCAKTCFTLHLDSNLTIFVSAPCNPGGWLIQ